MRCPRCSGQLLGRYGDRACLQCGHEPVTAAEQEAIAALAAESADKPLPQREPSHMLRDAMCPDCGRMYTGHGLPSHRRAHDIERAGQPLSRSPDEAWRRVRLAAEGKAE